MTDGEPGAAKHFKLMLEKNKVNNKSQLMSTTKQLCEAAENSDG